MFALRRVIVVSALGALGCSNILGADFDPDKTEPADGPKVTIALPEHPHEALHVGLPLPPASLTGSGKVTWSDGKGTCESSCTIAVDSGSVELFAEPADGSVFAGWRTEPSTECDGSRAPSCSLQVQSDVSVQAYMVKDGANVWGELTGAGDESSATPAALATAIDDGSSFVVIQYQGTLTGLTGLKVPTTDHDSDFLVARIGPDGEWTAASWLSTPGPESARDVAPASFGAVVAGTSLGSNGTSVTLKPLGQTLEGDGAFVVAYDSTASQLQPRWSWLVAGQGLTTADKVAVDRDDTTIVLGTYGQSLIASTATLTSDSGSWVYLAAIDANGTEKWVMGLADTDIGAGVGLAMQPEDTFIVAAKAGSAADLNALGGDCQPAPNTMFLARFNLNGHCSGVLSLPENVMSVDAMEVDAAGNVVIASRFTQEIELGGHAYSTIDESSLFIARFGPDLVWVDGVSWFVPIDGPMKFAALGASTLGAVFSISGDGAVFVDGTPFDMTATRTFQLGKLDSTGNLEWWRTLGDSPSSRVTAVEWDAKASVWVVAGALEADPFRPFDFENVTQTGTFLSGNDAFVARFAD